MEWLTGCTAQRTVVADAEVFPYLHWFGTWKGFRHSRYQYAGATCGIAYRLWWSPSHVGTTTTTTTTTWCRCYDTTGCEHNRSNSPLNWTAPQSHTSATTGHILSMSRVPHIRDMSSYPACRKEIDRWWSSDCGELWFILVVFVSFGSWVSFGWY